jgi:hypothetical protein
MFERDEDTHKARNEHARAGEANGGELEDSAKEREQDTTKFTSKGRLPPVASEAEGPRERPSASDLAEGQGHLGGSWGGLLDSASELLGGTSTAPEVKATNGFFGDLFGSSDKKQPAPITSRTTFKSTAPATRTTVGAGEGVDLESATAGNWSADGGTIYGGIKSSNPYWKAPSRAGHYTITLEVGGETVTKAFEVVEPDRIHYRKTANMAFAPGNAGAGMLLSMDLDPKHVSFANVEVKEVPHEAQSQDGYFLRPGAKAFDARHQPNPSWTAVLPGNNLLSMDRAEMEVDRLPKSEGGKWAKGKVVWKIPHNFRVVGDTKEKHFGDVTQTLEILNADGECRVTKGSDGAVVQRKPDVGPQEGDE